MTAIELIGYTGYVVGAAVILASKIKTDNLKDLRDRVEILEKELDYSRKQLEAERKEATKQHIANAKAIGELQKQLSRYR